MTSLVNKIIFVCVSPLTVALFLGGLALVCAFKWRKVSWGLGLFALLWLWIWSTKALMASLGLSLERQFPPVPIESIESADAIVILGGGAGANTNDCLSAELFSAADRIWKGAQLYKAQKALCVICTGGGVAQSTVPFLTDYGVPREDIVVLEDVGNTEDESRRIGEYLKEQAARRAESHKDSPCILLVTSAWHLPRALRLFQKNSGCRVIPVGCDYEATYLVGPSKPLRFKDFMPNFQALFFNTIYFKEYFAFWCYRLFKGY